MKRISLLIILLPLLFSYQLPGQDAATEERLNKLSGQIEDLLAAQAAQAKRIDQLAQEIADLRNDIAKPNPGYAMQEDLQRLADSVREVDQKRTEDYEKIRTEILNLAKTLTAPPVTPEATLTNLTSAATNAVTNAITNDIPVNDQYEYVVQPNDALSKIAQSYRLEKHIHVTVEDILKANPGLAADRIRPGQKIIIPVPAQ